MTVRARVAVRVRGRGAGLLHHIGVERAGIVFPACQHAIPIHIQRLERARCLQAPAGGSVLGGREFRHVSRLCLLRDAPAARGGLGLGSVSLRWSGVEECWRFGRGGAARGEAAAFFHEAGEALPLLRGR